MPLTSHVATHPAQSRSVTDKSVDNVSANCISMSIKLSNLDRREDDRQMIDTCLHVFVFLTAVFHIIVPEKSCYKQMLS